MDTPLYVAGQLLLALPGIGDPRFEHSAIAMCAHDGDGALGIDVGEEMDGLTLHELLATFDIDGSGIPDAPVLRGGPVEPRRGFVLHSLDWGGQEMLQVSDLWALSGSIDVLKAIASGKGPSRYLVALGYAGWSAGQLEDEVKRGGWFLAPADGKLLFDLPAHKRWAAAFRSGGVDPALLVGGTGSA